jgi:hypothetical protein
VKGEGTCKCYVRILRSLSRSGNASVCIMRNILVTRTCICLCRTPAALERVESGVSRSASSGEVGDGDPGVDAGGRKRGSGLSARKEDVERELKVLDETIENLENSRRVSVIDRFTAHGA